MTNITKVDSSASSAPEESKLKFSDLGISASILEILKKLNLEDPTPIQQKTIPTAITGQDVIGIAQTGTGKTFAYGIPMLQRIGASKGQGLVIAPTRELAAQVEENLKKLGQALGLRTALLIGGDPFDRQLFLLRKKPHVVVATPGRLIDHLKRKTFKLDQINTLVLDEADMMLDMGFAPQVQEILKQAPVERQTLLFSATMPAAIVKIAATFMKLPVSIEVAPSGTTAEQVDQEIFIINGEERLEHLVKILTKYAGSVLVFVRTKHGVKNLTQKLQSLGHKADEIHSNLSLGRRKTALANFKSKKTRILVATDVAARGLDINGIELVVNYNLPDNSEDYVHRIGRTGRAGHLGKAITFATAHEQREIRSIEKLINKNIKITEFVKLAKESFPSAGGRGKKKSFSGNSQFRGNSQGSSTRGASYGGARGASRSSAFGSSRSANSRGAASRSVTPHSSVHSAVHSVVPGVGRPSSGFAGKNKPSSHRFVRSGHSTTK